MTTPNRKPGRPTKLTVELADAVAAEIIDGAQYQNAFRKCGVYKQLAYNWEQQGKADLEAGVESVFAYWLITMDIAKGNAVATAEQSIYHKCKDWQARARWLEAADKEHWIRSERQELTTPPGEQPPIQSFMFLLPDGTKVKPKDLINAGS